jgi:hypothetical protein
MRLCEKNILKIFQDNILEAFRKAQEIFSQLSKSSQIFSELLDEIFY